MIEQIDDEKQSIKVTIITVCFNSEKTIRRTMESVLCQTYKDIEYIVVDGASTDATMDIVKEYEKQFEGKMQYISEKDNGIYDAMNKGIHKATGRLIGILNSDDYYETTAVESMVHALTNRKYEILYGFTRTVQAGKEVCISRYSHELLNEQMIAHPSCFVTKSVYDDFGGFDLQYPCVADYDFMLRMFRISDIHFKPVDRLIANFSVGGISNTPTAWLDLLRLRKNYNMITEREYNREIAKDKLYTIYRKLFAK